jgi:hypothetical protein
VILPTKHLQPDRALITVGAELLRLLDEPITVSQAWDQFRRARSSEIGAGPVSYDWFVLGLDLLYVMGVIRLDRGRVYRVEA